jgi:multiple sugar transport system ATP-binding protein
MYGIRPEHLQINPSGVAAEVVLVEPTGYETHLITRFGGHEFTSVLHERVSYQPGATVHLSPIGRAAHFFDAETKKRIE